MHQHGRLVLGQVGDAYLVDRFLAIANRPGGALRLLVHGAIDGQRGITQRIVVVAADRSLLVDRKLEQVIAVGLFALHHREYAQRQPIVFLVGLGLLARVRDGDGLLRVLLLRADRVTVHVNSIAFVDDIRAVVIVDRFDGIAAVAGAISPAGHTP